MRTAVVVVPVLTIAAAIGLTAYQLHRSRAVARADRVSPPECGVRRDDLPPAQRAAAVATIKPPPAKQAPPTYAAPVGGQFLTEWNDLLIGKGDGPPMLFVLGAGDLNGRYEWRMPRVARVMAEELAAVLDDGCTAGCSPAADAARTAAHAYLDGDVEVGIAKTRAWDTDDAGITNHMHRLAMRSRAGAITVDVTCTCASWTVGMRMWNDVTACDATLRDKGRVLATYQPRVRAMSDKESIEEPMDSYDQIVALPGGAMLVTETGWEYSGDNVTTPARKTVPRTGPHWR